MSMSSSVQLLQSHLPFQRDHYDSTPQLSAAEQMALHACMDYLSSTPWWPPSSHESLQTLKRLLTPIDAILALAQCPKERYPQVKRFLCQEMYQRRTSFWDWSAEQWSEIIGTRSRDFCQRYTTAQLEVRLYLTVIGYLLGSVTHPDVFEGISSYMLAKKVFGIICVEEAIQRVATALNDLGYTQYGQTRSAATAVGYVLLLNRSPLLTEITFEVLEIAQQRKRESYLRYNLVALSQALVHLGIISHALDHVKSEVLFHSGVDSACRVTPSASLPSVTHTDGRHNFFPDLTQFDRRPALTKEEHTTLTVMEERLQRGVIQWRGEWRPALERLLLPLYMVLNQHKANTRNIGNVHILLKEMQQRQCSFWAWSRDDWLDIIGESLAQFRQRYGATSSSRLLVAAVSYLLCGMNEISVLSTLDSCLFAKKVFGETRVEEACQQVLSHMDDLGYNPSRNAGVRNLLCLALVYNRSPIVTDMTLEVLITLQRAPIRLYLKESLLVLSRLLASASIISRSLPSYYPKDWGQNVYGRHQSLPHEERFSVSDMQEQSSSHASQDTAFNNPPSMSPRWQWPLDITVYDRTPQLTEMERTELTLMMDRFARGILPWRKASRDILQRLLHPMYDVFQMIGTKTSAYSGITHVLLEEMHRRQTSFWAWSEYEWIETIGQHEGDFSHRHGGKKDDAYRQSVAVVGYLLGQFNTLTLVDRISPYLLACKIFGTTQVDQAVQQIHHTLASWGYADARYKAIKNALCVVFLSNRSPLLSDISLSLLETLQVSQMPQYLKHDLVLISLALVTLGLLSSPLKRLTIARAGVGENGDESPSQEQNEGDASVERKNIPDPQWLAWCKRWRDTSPLAAKTRTSTYYSLLQAGRWLKQEHPEVNTPEGWNRELAAEYVGAVGHMTIGQWSQPATIPARLIGKPIMARQQAHLLSAMRTFFRDCQEWQWISMRFDPRRSFATPRSVRGRIGPNPRVLADDVWAKLLAAGLSVTAHDFVNLDLAPSRRHRSHPAYPLEMLRALVVLWLFGGLRSDEICRLRVGCVRFVLAVKDEGPSLVAESKSPSQVCLLDIPVNKTETAFTKPVDLVVGEAIVAWEKVRPVQPAMLDPKTGEVVHFLFAFRLSRLAKQYLNEVIIPALCRKAGIPRSDARGNITSHRARSTIASQLANAKEPMTLFELQQWLGHKSPEATRNYLKSSPTKLAQAYADADYFKRNLRTIEVLLDQDVVKSGAASLGEPWRFYDLGHGYCTYDFFDQCPHRMACAKCAFYRPKGSSQAQMLEAKANLLRLRQEIPLSDEEKAAVDDGLIALEQLCENLLDIPTPAGPTPRELEVRGKRMLPMVSLSNEEGDITGVR